MGLGLIGGSIAFAARRAHAFDRILAADRSGSRLKIARRRGVIDGSGSIEEVASHADVLVLAAAPQAIPALVPRGLRYLRPGCLATDTGSTKRSVVAAVPPLPGHGPWFVPAHPLAGSERRGLDGAEAHLLLGAACALTPRRGTPPVAINRALAFWRSLGLCPFVVSAAAHDRAVARTSHLVLLLAAMLCDRLDRETMRFAGPAFRDATRVAASDPSLWAAILRENRDEVRRSLHWLRADLECYLRFLSKKDDSELHDALSRASRARKAFSRELAKREAAGTAPATARSSRGARPRIESGRGAHHAVSHRDRPAVGRSGPGRERRAGGGP